MHKRAKAVLAFIVVAGQASAQPITDNNLPRYSPPYGAFVLDITGGQTGVQIRETRLAIAKKYGYASTSEARIACHQTKKFNDECGMDAVAHRRAESPEIKKYGFKTWKEAVEACDVASRKHRDTAAYCTADPFIRLRSKG